jgi:SusD/RagB-like outer membrane lipoprotein
MKQRHSILYILLVMASFTLGACSRDKFAALNTSPDAVTSIPPENELPTGQMNMFNNSFEAFYDLYMYMRPWTQLWVYAGGNSGTSFTTPVSTQNFRYSQFYSNVGPPLVDVQHLISIQPPAKQATYVYLNAIAGINLAEYAFYTSDPNGAMPYSAAFQARYSGNLTPVWDTQEALFDTLDTQLKSYVATLETQQPVQQNTGGANDLIYQGNVTNWIKAANSLRLRIAMRLMKQNPAQLTTVANEVLSDAVGLIDNTGDEWVFHAGASFLSGSNNWAPIANAGPPCMEKNVVSFLVKSQDPRIRAILLPAAISSQAMFDSAKAQSNGLIPASAQWDGQVYRGQYASPDSAKDPNKAYYFQTLNFSFYGVQQTVNYPSIVQSYILDGQYSTTGATGSGLNVFSVITYADVCFMRAELVLRGLSNDPLTAQQLYTMGVTASIQDYDAWAQLAQTPGYVPLGSNEISNYLSQPGVAYQPSTALEQVLVQEYLNVYMNPNEAWALIKRTGYPSPTGVILPLENLTTGGSPLLMPRRYVVTYPQPGDLNYTNDINAINAELQLPGFGTINDIAGKVWWDQ